MNREDNLVLTRQEDNDEIDLLDLFNTLLKGKWIIIALTFFSLALAFLYAYGSTSIYKADAMIRIESQKSSIPNIEDLVGLSNNADSTGTEIEILKSRNLIRQTVEDLNLNIIARPKKLTKLSNLYQRFFNTTEIKKPNFGFNKINSWAAKYSWGNEQIKLDRFDVPIEFQNKTFTLAKKQNNSFDLFHEELLILRGIVGKTSTTKDKRFRIFVSVLTGLPDTEYTVIKSSVRKIVSSLRDRVKAEEKNYSKYYTGIMLLSLTGSNKEKIIKTLDNVSNTYIKQNKSRSSTEANNALIFLEEQIGPIERKLEVASTNLKKYRSNNETTNLPQETQDILKTIVDINAELLSYSLSRDDLSRKFTQQHPAIQSLKAKENKLIVKKAQIQDKIKNLPQTQQKLFTLERDLQVSNTTYLELLNKIQEFKIAKASTVGNAYIVDTADIDDKYLKPNRVLLLAIGTLLGGFLGIVVIFLKDVFLHRINNPEKLEKLFGIPVYATIPFTKNVKLTNNIKSKLKKQKSLLALDNNSDPVIESLRSLRTSLHFALHEAKNNIVMITGPAPYIGKSFISSNLASVSASSGQRSNIN